MKFNLLKGVYYYYSLIIYELFYYIFYISILLFKFIVKFNLTI
jgi:hypothetical protein